MLKFGQDWPLNIQSHLSLWSNRNNPRYLTAFEVCPCLPCRRQQEGFAGPQREVRTVTTERAGTQSSLWHLEAFHGLGYFCMKADLQQKDKQRRDAPISTPKAQETLGTWEVTCTHPHALHLLIPAALFSYCDLQTAHSLHCFKSIWRTSSGFKDEVENKNILLILMGKKQAQFFWNIISGIFHQKHTFNH